MSNFYILCLRGLKGGSMPWSMLDFEYDSLHNWPHILEHQYS